jgi:hypothetical protein
MGRPTMNDWETKIAKCFGNTDVKFAFHDTESQYAYELLGNLRSLNVTWEAVKLAFEDWLDQRTTDAKNKNAQMIRVQSHFEIWLDHL